jgi:hypothetical protein
VLGKNLRSLPSVLILKKLAAVASAKKLRYMKVYDRPGTEDGWHFLTLSEGSVKALMESIGFRFKWNERVKSGPMLRRRLLSLQMGSFRDICQESSLSPGM